MNKRRVPTFVLYIIVGCLVAAQLLIGILWKVSLRQDNVSSGADTNLAVTESEQSYEIDGLIQSGYQANESVSQTEYSPDLLLQIMDDETLIVQTHADGVVEALNDTNYLNIDFLLDKGDGESWAAAELSIMKMSDTAYQITGLVRDSEDEYFEDVEFVSPIDYFTISDTAISYTAISSKFLDKVKNCERYRIYTYDENFKEPVGTVAEAFLAGDTKYTGGSVASIPDEFITSEEDAKYFVPASDDFKIIEITIYRGALPFIGYYHDRMGYLMFGADTSRYAYYDEPVKIVYLISYDDVGPIDGKAKIVYASEEARDYTTFCKSVYMEELTGLNEQNDDAVAEVVQDLIDESDDYYINYYYSMRSVDQEIHISSKGITYNGRHDLARYFSYKLEGQNRQDGGYIVALPGVSYFEPEIQVDKIDTRFTFAKNEIVDNGDLEVGYPVRTYSSFEN